MVKKTPTGPRVLIFDLETAPMLAYVWSLWDDNVPLDRLISDWYVLSWSAKWLGEKEIMYMDQRDAKDIEDDKKIMKGIWKLLDEADVVITQNGKRFDVPKLNTRFIMHGMQPPSPFKHIDTYQIAKRKFAFSSNKLAFLTSKLCATTKSDHKKFPGFSLWKACLNGDPAAWKEMEKYNKLDVSSLEELYYKISPWDKSVDLGPYWDANDPTCHCGSKSFIKFGYGFKPSGKFQRHRCKECGKTYLDKVNLLSKEKRSKILKPE